MEAQSKVFVSGYGYITKEEANKVKLYKYFMYNSANICNCSDCPENAVMFILQKRRQKGKII